MRKMIIAKDGIHYQIDGQEVTRKQYDANWSVPSPDYENGECCAVRPDLNDFSMENRGRGRYNPQMAKKPNDPDAYFTSVNKVKDAAARRGMSTEN